MRLEESKLKKMIRNEIEGYLEENGGTPGFEPKLIGKFQASSGERSLVLRDKLGRGPHFVIMDERGREVFEMTPDSARELKDFISDGLTQI